jgi:hypothetical protein
MATFTKFECFVEDIAHGKHDFSADQVMVALVAAANAPDTATDGVLGDLTEAAYTFCSTREITTTSSGQTDGVWRLVLADLTLTASGGSVGPFRYLVIYNDDAPSKELIGVLDWGSDVTLASGDSFDLDFDPTDGAIDLT